MKHTIILPMVAALALVACNNEPEVTEGEVPNATDVVDTGPEVVETDAPPTAQAGAVSWDKDNDRVFDRDEFTGFGDQGFLGWDTDDDDEIGPDEFRAGWEQLGFADADQAFDAFDDNNNNLIEQDEFFAEDEFAEWDANNNDVLERDEFAFYAA